MLEALDGPALARALEQERRNAVKTTDATRSLADDEAQLAQLARDFADRRISRLEWLTARDAIEDRLDRIRGRLAAERRVGAVAKYVGKANVLRRQWPALTLDQRRAVMSAVLDYVKVGPAVRGRNVFDPSRVALTWRF